jgi:hypothetical protein
MTQARGGVINRIECVTQKPVMLWAHYFTTQGWSQAKCNPIYFERKSFLGVGPLYRVEFLEKGFQF